MEEKTYDENVKLLANAIIIRACEDYKECAKMRYGIEAFLLSDWFTLLSRGAVTPHAIIKHLQQEVYKNGSEIYHKKKFFGNRAAWFV